LLSMIPHKDDVKETKSLKDMLIDSGIVATIAFLSALPPDRPPSFEDFYVALYAFAMSFVLQLAVYRGLRKHVPVN